MEPSLELCAIFSNHFNEATRRNSKNRSDGMTAIHMGFQAEKGGEKRSPGGKINDKMNDGRGHTTFSQGLLD